ncbi:hypothetical protein GMORB2_3256 [Geosmithia morbida]|uniref:Uncharacterized protein n=1 Tax=Geosmithia morbida TaxID=1094350 RepID=A0A9P4YQX0_9HYPO|nr:uncharacterized protein GMORB2_3256 [Geosmithia morbida]KAF4120129.1 hypothetical protein GMORB2_3256 [Geosmithia morbida]
MVSASTGRQASEPISIDHDVRDHSDGPEFSTPDSSISGCYFSFPNFDNWGSTVREEDKEP